MRGRAKNRKSPAWLDDAPVLRIANDESILHTPSREIRAHVEFARISRRLDLLECSEKRELVTHIWMAAPADENGRVRFKVVAVHSGVAQFQKKNRDTVSFDFWLGRDNASHGCRARPLPSNLSERIRRSVRDACGMEEEKSCGDDGKNERSKTPAQSCHRASDRDPQDQGGNCWTKIGCNNADNGGENETDKWLPHEAAVNRSPRGRV